MNEEPTRDLPDTRSFEDRVFARFDVMEARFEVRFSSMDGRLDSVAARLDRVEARLDTLDARVHALEARAIDTKPIWERALTEILAIKDRVENIERKFDVLTLDMMQLRGDQRRVETRMDALESRLQ